MQGIVTQTDLLEAIAGDLPEADNEPPEFKVREDGAFEVDGAMSILDAQERLGLGSLLAGDFNTVAGFVLELFGRIPAAGEQIDWDGWRSEIAVMDGLRIRTVSARRSGRDKAAGAEAHEETG